MSYTIVNVEGYGLSVKFESRVIRIKNNSTLKNMLKGLRDGSGTAAYILKKEYRKKMGKEIDISANSLAVEILGHVYPDKIVKAIKSFPVIKNISGITSLADQFLTHTTVVDCGETDPDRVLWDLLASFHGIIGGMIVE